MPQSYPVSDLVQWMQDKTLVLNPEFQRRDIWPEPAKSYFIETLLLELPIPNIYMRSVTETVGMRTHREVVDGQQRLRTIREFVENRLRLGINAGSYAGMQYGDLDVGDQKRFLAYQLGVEQLFEASDDKVLDIFNRLNAYGLRLNPQELRHGKYQGGVYKGVFRRVVIESARKWSVLWDKYRVVSLRARVRMADDELMAQMLGILIEGVQDGGQPAIKRLYDKYDDGLPSDAVSKLDQVVSYLLENLSDVMNSRIGNAPHFLMLFAAMAHALFGIPEGDMKDEYRLPDRDERPFSDVQMIVQNLETLEDVLDAQEDNVHKRFAQFKLASSRTTQRMRSRSVRFLKYYEALLPDPI